MTVMKFKKREKSRIKMIDIWKNGKYNLEILKYVFIIKVAVCKLIKKR